MFRLLIIFFLLPLLFFGQEHQGGFTFIENKNQWHPNVLYKADVKGGYFYLQKDGFVFDLLDVKRVNEYIEAHYDKSKTRNFKPIDCHAYKVEFVGANSNPKVVGKNKTPAYYNYFLGKDSTKWASYVHGFHTIEYQSIYDGIDARVYTKLFDLKYDFIVKKGATPNQIKLKYKGADKIAIIKDRLHIYTKVNHVIEDKPFVYQIVNGKVKQVTCNYVLNENELSFEFPNGYDKTLDLIIDPTLKFSTYSGSFSNNFGYSATFDSKGFLYSGSSAFGSLYPTTLGAYSTTFSGGRVDIAISKFDTTGTFLIYSTYLGGDNDELPHSLIVNSLDELFILGTTSSSNFPTTVGCYDATFNGGTPNNLQNGLGVNYTNGSDLIISHLSADGSSLLGSTYLGGSQNDGLNSTSTNRVLNILRYNYADEIRGEIDIDKNNNIYIVSCTRSPDYPVTAGAFQTTYGGGAIDACITKLDNGLQNVIWSSFLGGEKHDAGYSLALDNNDDLYVTGGTESLQFPTTSGAYQPSFQGGRSDGFVTKISKNGQTILNSTYYGSASYDQSYFVEVDKNNAVFLFGQTEHTGNNFIQNATWSVAGSGQFISKLSPDLSSRIYSTVFGSGNGINISPTAFLVDVCDKIYLSGWGGNVNHLSSLYNNTGFTTNMPITGDAFQSTTDGSDFYVMVMQDDASSLIYGSYFGSASASEHVDGGTSRFDRKGKIYQAMCAGCGGDSNMPIFPSNAVSTTNNNSCNLGVFKMDFEIPSIIADFVAPPLGCAPYSYTFENTSLVQSGTTYQWDFGDGTTSTLENPTHVYTQQGTYDIVLIVNDANSCNLSDTITQQIQVLGNTSSNLASVSMCPNQTVQIGMLPNPNPAITYQWSPNTGLSDATVSNPFATLSSTTDFTLLVSNGTCTDTLHQTVIVNTPQLSVSNDTTLCFSPSSLSLTANSFGTSNTFIWSTTSSWSDTLNTITDSVLSITPNVSSTYYVKINNNGCEKMDSVSITTIYGNTTISGTNATCGGDTVTLTSSSTLTSNAIQYQWTPNQYVLSGISSPVLVANPSSTITYQLTVTADICQQTISYPITVTNVDVFIPNDTIVCNANLGVNFTATSSLGNTSFVWSTSTSFSDTINSNVSNGSVFVLPQNDTTLYILAQSNGCTIIDSATVDIVFGQTSIVGDTAICQGDAILLQATNTADTNNVNYNWEPDAFIVNGDGSASVFVQPQSNQTFVLYAENGGCYDTLFHTIWVTPIQLSTTNDTTLCFDTTLVNLSANSFGTSASFLWSSSALFADTLNTPISNNEITVQGQDYGVYYVKVENGGCTLIDSVEVMTVFSNFNVSFPAVLCYGDSMVVVANNDFSNVPIVYDWSPDVAIISGDGTDSILISPQQSTNYSLNASYANCQLSENFAVSVVHLQLSTHNDTVLCNNNSILDLWASSNQTSTNYIWSSNVNFSDTLNTPLSDSTITISPTQPTTYYVQISESGCTLHDSVKVVVATGQLEIQGVNEICRGDEVTLTVVNLAPDYPMTYNWSPDSLIVSGDSTSTIIVLPDSTTVFTVTGVNSFGCAVTVSTTVNVNSIGFGNVFASASNDTIIEGETVVLYANPNNPNYSYHWSNFELELDVNTWSTEVALDGTTTFYLTVEKNGCTRTDSITIFVKELLCGEEDSYVPNSFTPNSDNVNDVLYVRGNNIKEMVFRIYDRWGEMVFETQDQTVGWDGTFKEKECDPAVFVYYLEVTCKAGETYFEKGNITLIR